MIRVIAVPQERGAPAWSVRLAADLDANDQFAKKLVAELTDEQLNWQPAPGPWSVGQCLEHLSITNEAYLPPISVAVNEQQLGVSCGAIEIGKAKATSVDALAACARYSNRQRQRPGA